jgi:hypothetical protein
MKATYLSIFLYNIQDFALLSIFQGERVSQNEFILPLNDSAIKTAINSVQYVLADKKYDLVICN